MAVGTDRKAAKTLSTDCRQFRRRLNKGKRKGLIDWFISIYIQGKIRQQPGMNFHIKYLNVSAQSGTQSIPHEVEHWVPCLSSFQK